MRTLWFFFLVGLSAGSMSEKLFVLSESVDDLYIEGLPSGDSPVDDEGGDDHDGSGSGSGDYSLWTVRPTETSPATAESPYTSPTTASGPGPALSAEETSFSNNRNMLPGEDSTSNYLVDTTSSSDIPFSASTKPNWDISENSVEDVLTKMVDVNVFADGGRHGRMNDINSAEGVTSENLWDRTDVLAAVIACGVVGFLCAVSLLLLLAYRMKKKDEGSYELGDTKLSATAYRKAPTKEFYA
ncbi:syndecan-2-A [Nematolebias whitei]|uniref:syndecan-2-A n=1 Tax=Nematolebias whitei TaxID=451745 RepID=UPI001896CE7A|nr:syndecan-2-A [Nematolebias whitei]